MWSDHVFKTPAAHKWRPAVAGGYGEVFASLREENKKLKLKRQSAKILSRPDIG
jgi:hypothetical protein